MNCMRVPALQTLLLYSKSLDTNVNCTRILCDNWLELAFLDSEQTQDLVLKVMRLRKSIENLFKTKLDCYSRVSDDVEEDDQASKRNKESAHDAAVNEHRLENLTRLLKNKLAEFLDFDILYSLRRVLPAELKTMFIRNYEPNQVKAEGQPVDMKGFQGFEGVKQNTVKGGFKPTEYLTFNW
jgi:hypothetical protein